MEIFSPLLAICARNSPASSEFPAQRPVTRSFNVFFDPCLNGWENNREAGDLRRYRAHYDVISMWKGSMHLKRTLVIFTSLITGTSAAPISTN